MKQYLNEVEHDVKVRFQIICVAMVGLCLAMAAAVLGILHR